VADTERVALQAVFDAIRRFSIGHDVISKAHLQQALFSHRSAGAQVAGATNLQAEHDNAPRSRAPTCR
jgi:hypothetical protein